MNLQGTCDADGRFLDIYIGCPGSTSDFLAFQLSPLKHLLEDESFLADGLCLFGDNAYVNTAYMATPFKAVTSQGKEDNYNFFHSQLRINIECAFGKLVHRWAILRKPLHCNLGLAKSTSLVAALCKLHNFCIDRNLTSQDTILASDEVGIMCEGGISISTFLENEDNNHCPQELLHGGEHYEDFDMSNRKVIERSHRRRLKKNDLQLPRDSLCLPSVCHYVVLGQVFWHY